MNKKHSKLEMFMRKMMSKLQLGYQCCYKNRAHNIHRQGTKGHWSIRIWDQRSEHYTKATKSDICLFDSLTDQKEPRLFYGQRVSYNSSPSQKWYNNQHTDCEFEVIGPEYHGVGSTHKDDFLKWLLFDGNLFKEIAKELRIEFGFEGNRSLSGIQLSRSISNLSDVDYSELSRELNELKKSMN